MSVDRTPQDRYYSDKRQADQSIAEQIKLIAGNLNNLARARMGAKKVEDFKSMKADFEAGISLSPKQRNYIEAMYEACFDGAGYEAAKSHHDKSRSLRFPKT